MLNLFKLPFWANTSCLENQMPAHDLSKGIFKNYLSRKSNQSDTSATDAQQFIDSELEDLQNAMYSTPGQDRYEMIVASLRRIDNQLDKL